MNSKELEAQFTSGVYGKRDAVMVRGSGATLWDQNGRTFGGNPLACAAALATLDIIEQEQLVERSADLGTYFRDRLRAINSPLIRDVRGLGLMIGFDLRIRAMPIVKRLMEEGILVLTAGKTVIRLLPPLVITREQVDTVVTALELILAEQEKTVIT